MGSQRVGHNWATFTYHTHILYSVLLLLLSHFSRVWPLRPHRRQPTRLPCPWDSLSKNTGMGCHFLLQCMKVKSENEVTQSCPIPSDPMDCSLPGSSVHGIFPGKSTGVGCGPLKHHSLENQQTQTLLTLYSPRNFTVSETVESLGQ